MDSEAPRQDRQLPIAALGDLHFDLKSKGRLRGLFSDIARDARILVLCGDLTTRGEPEEMEGFVEELHGIEIPIVAVLGNHDFDAGQEQRLCEILSDRGVQVLDGTSVEIEGIGFAGVKGFGGGFGRRTLGPFGEPIYKAFVQETINETLKLENALRSLNTETRIVVLHYAPIRETLTGEPEEIFPFLGSSRLLAPIETYGANAVFHGHAHAGTPEARTPGGIPVFNVAHELLAREYGRPYRLWSALAPDRRQRSEQEALPQP